MVVISVAFAGVMTTTIVTCIMILIIHKRTKEAQRGHPQNNEPLYEEPNLPEYQHSQNHSTFCTGINLSRNECYMVNKSQTESLEIMLSPNECYQ